MKLKIPNRYQDHYLSTFFSPHVWKYAEASYSQGVRAYHTFNHAKDVLSRVMYFDDEIGFMNPEAARLAALFHDAVYRTSQLGITNEQLSCSQMQIALSYDNALLLDGPYSKAAGLILETQNHTVPRKSFTDWDTCLFMDCDMLGFADEPEQFRIQNDNIAIEYGQKPYELTAPYIQGRLAFLKNLRARGVFLSPPVRKAFESRAIENINHEIKELNISL
jgi:predicted metal-dependent HD superfamily phosphohydrolase